MDKVITTERLILRRWRDSDAERLYCLASVPEIGRGAGWISHKDPDYSKAIIRSILADDGEYAIVVKNIDDLPIGSIGIRIGTSEKRGILREDEAEIGYWIGKDYWNRGYATEALSELIRIAFVDIGLNRVWCSFFDGNMPSQAVTIKCGMSFHHKNENLYNSMLKKNYNETMMCISAEEYFKS